MTNAQDHLPLKAVPYLALLLLAEEPTYGVRLMERLEERSSGRITINAGSLYRMIAGLVEDGLVEPLEGEEPSGPGAPPKRYGVTELGRAVLRAEAERQAALLEMARALDLGGSV